MTDDTQTGHALKSEDSPSSAVAIVGVQTFVIGLKGVTAFEFRVVLADTDRVRPRGLLVLYIRSCPLAELTIQPRSRIIDLALGY
jgi:hypothetical protein